VEVPTTMANAIKSEEAKGMWANCVRSLLLSSGG